MIKLLKTYAEQIKSLLNLNVSTYLKKTREEFTTQLIKGHAITSGIQFMPGFSDYFNLQNPNPMDSKEIEPYVDFAHEPNPIIQLKTVINILYHFEVVFRELEEHKDFNLSTFDILLDSYTIWEKKTIDRAYHAGQLIGHLDADLLHMFWKEYENISKFFNEAKKYYHITIEMLAASQPTSHQIGGSIGTLINHMQTDPNKVDYSYLTHFGAILPKHIQDATNYIRQYARVITTHAPTVDKDNIQQLEKNAITLLSAINDVQSNPALLAINWVSYIKIFRHIIELSTVTLSQVGQLSDVGQTAIRNNLVLIKSNLSEILSFSDKIESTLLLTPGALSKPLEANIHEYYATLVYYLDKVAELGPLSTLNNPGFMAQRLNKSEYRIQKAQHNLFVAKESLIAFDKFFFQIEMLNSPESGHKTNYRLIDLQEMSKRTLVNYYRQFQSFVQAYSSQLNKEIRRDLTTNVTPSDQLVYFAQKANHIIYPKLRSLGFSLRAYGASCAALLKSQKPKTNHAQLELSTTNPALTNDPEGTNNSPTLWNGLSKSLNRIKNTLFSDYQSTFIKPEEPLHFPTSLRYLISIKNSLRKSLESAIATQEITIKNIEEIVKRVTKSTELKLCPHDPLQENKFNFHEGYALKNTGFTGLELQKHNPGFGAVCTLAHIDRLDAKLSHFVCEYYKSRILAMTNAQNAFSNFMQAISLKFKNDSISFLDLDAADKIHLKSQYLIFQPWLMSIPSNNPCLLELDKMIIYGFNSKVKVQLWREKQTIEKNTLYIRKSGFLLEYAIIDYYGIERTGMITTKQLKSKLNNTLTEEDLHRLQPALLEIVIKANHTSPDPETSIINRQQLEALNTNFNDTIKCALLFANTRAELFANNTIRAYQAHVSQRPLYTPVAQSTRIDLLIKNARLSEKIKTMTSQFDLQIRQVANSCITDYLVPRNKGVPYPEQKEQITPEFQVITLPQGPMTFSQNKQLANLKNVFNGLYHMQHALIVIENLDDDSYQLTYLTQLIEIYDHLYKLTHAIFALRKDSHLSYLTNELLANLNQIKDTINRLKTPYVASQPTHSPGLMEINPLWYTLHGLILTPEQIKASYSNKSLTKEERDVILANAKAMGIVIERVIKRSNSYFYLLLETPAIYSLYSELKEKLLSFMHITYTAGTDEGLQFLENLNKSWFASFFVNIDQMEFNLGINPGVLSLPFREILSEFYKGMLEPLNLSSRRHLSCLRTGIAILESRAIANQKHLDYLQLYTAQYIKHHVKLQKAVDLMERYAQCSSTSLKASIGAEFNEAYIAVYPVLKNYEDSTKAASIGAYTFPIPNNTNHYLVNNSKLLFEIKTIHLYYTQLCFAAKLECGSAHNKKIEINNLINKQQDEDHKHLSDYIDRLFDLSAKEKIEKQTPPAHLNKDYRDSLQRFLQREKKQITAESIKLAGRIYSNPRVENSLQGLSTESGKPNISQDDKGETNVVTIDLKNTIDNAIQNQVNLFNASNLNDYKKLNAIIATLHKFKDYADSTREAIEASPTKSSIFEDLTTLNRKVKLVSKLLELATNHQAERSPEKRLEKIRKEINGDRFKEEMLPCCKFNKHWMPWLKQWLYYLLTQINLYTPEHVKHTYKLSEISKPEEPAQPPKRWFRFFYSERQSSTTAPAANGINPTANIDMPSSKAIWPATV